MFADDIKLYSIVNSVNDCVTLQGALDRLLVWSSVWQLPISATKCSTVNLGVAHVAHNFTLGSSVLPHSLLSKDLGITIDPLLKLDQHIRAISRKGHVKANLIRRSFLTRDHKALTKAFVSYVRPALEYCSVVWSPSYIGLIRQIESVQRLFTKRMHGLWDLSYRARLNLLGLQTLEHRRLLFDLHMCFMINRGLVDLSTSDFFSLGLKSTRGHGYKLMHSHSHINARKHLSVRVVPIWNSLPASVVDAPTFPLFKKRLLALDLSAHLVTITD